MNRHEYSINVNAFCKCFKFNIQIFMNTSNLCSFSSHTHGLLNVFIFKSMDAYISLEKISIFLRLNRMY